jgi:hypothetical protein
MGNAPHTSTKGAMVLADHKQGRNGGKMILNNLG